MRALRFEETIQEQLPDVNAVAKEVTKRVCWIDTVFRSKFEKICKTVFSTRSRNVKDSFFAATRYPSISRAGDPNSRIQPSKRAT